MSFVKLLLTASRLKKLKRQLEEEKQDSILLSHKQKPKWRCRHLIVDIRNFFKRCLWRILDCFCLHKFCYKLRRDGSIENYFLKSITGYVSGMALTFIFFLFFVFQLNFQIGTATIVCSLLGILLMIGLAFSLRIRCIVLLTLPQFFSQKGRQALIAYAFVLAISGPAKNTLDNMGIMSESLACGQEQLKSAVRQIIEVIKRPFIAIKEAIKKVVKTVKEVIKKIKEIFLKIKRIVMAIVGVIKAAFQFLGKILNICNKELGTPFERCSRVFENAVLDCNAKLGPLFSWLCSLTYIVKSVCYLVKPFDLVCMLVDFISNSVIGVVIRKVKAFIRHVKTMFYVRIKFSHSFEYHMNSTKSIAEISEGIIREVKERTQTLQSFFHFLTSAATLFFLFIIFKYRFLTSERFDNRYINKDFHDLDIRRAKLGQETVLPLNNKEAQLYIPVKSGKLVKSEKKALTKAMSTLATTTMKIGIMMGTDYCLFWVLNLIRYYGRFQSKMQAPNLPTAHISGTGLLADLLRSIVKAFQPVGITLEIDTVQCLPTPIPPNYDRYVQLATLLLLCWILTFLEPYGLRMRHVVMSYYHPERAKQRAVWLYNHIMRSRNSFLKFARRQLRRKVLGAKGIEKVTCKEYLAANFKVLAVCLDTPQVVCLLCGHVFREGDESKPIRCQTPGCIGVYCEQCFSDLQNLCTLCLSPIDYGDLSDIDEEKDSSEEERLSVPSRKESSRWKCFKRKRKRLQKKDTLLQPSEPSSELSESPEEDRSPRTRRSSLFKRKKRDPESLELLPRPSEKKIPGTGSSRTLVKPSSTEESDPISSDVSSDYSYSYQYEKKDSVEAGRDVTTFKDVEKQEIPDYASMESFKEVSPPPPPPPPKTRGVKAVAETKVSGVTLRELGKDRHIGFKDEPDQISLMEPMFCVCSDSSEEQPLASDSTISGLQNILRKPDEKIPSPLEVCSCHEKPQTSSETTPPSTYSSRNYSSSSIISSPEVPKSDRLKGGGVDKTELPPAENFKASLSHRNKAKQYYKSIRTIPTGSVKTTAPRSSKLRNLVSRIAPKRKNLGELPLYISDETELQTFSTPQGRIQAPRCRCRRGTTRSGDLEFLGRQRGGGLVERCQSYWELARRKEDELSPLLSSHFPDLDDLTPTRDTDVQMSGKRGKRFSGLPRRGSSNLSLEVCLDILGVPQPQRRRPSIDEPVEPQVPERESDGQLPVQEIQVASQTSHPSILKVRDASPSPPRRLSVDDEAPVIPARDTRMVCSRMNVPKSDKNSQTCDDHFQLVSQCCSCSFSTERSAQPALERRSDSLEAQLGSSSERSVDRLHEEEEEECGCRWCRGSHVCYDQVRRYQSENFYEDTRRRYHQHQEVPRCWQAGDARRSSFFDEGPMQMMRTSCHCNGECRCSLSLPPPPPTPPPLPPGSFRFHSTHSLRTSCSEESMETTVTGAYPEHLELAYQSNPAYMALMDELEGALQGRTKDRIIRAIMEFEYNRTHCRRVPTETLRARPLPRPKRSCRRRTTSHWRLDPSTGDWYKVLPPTCHQRRTQFCPYDCNCPVN